MWKRLRTLLAIAMVSTWSAAAIGAIIVCVYCLFSIWQQLEVL